jgi:hypothetical protein
MKTRTLQKNTIKSISICISLLFLSGCFTTVKNVNNKDSFNAVIESEGKSLVIGKILWLENGKERKGDGGLFSSYITPQLLRLENRQKIMAELDENGNFAWLLEPGFYVINRLNYRDVWSGNYFFVTQSAFMIKENSKFYYVGTLKMNFMPKRDLIGGLSGVASFEIMDEGESGYTATALRFGLEPDVIEKSLMVHDKRLPLKYNTTVEFNAAISLLNLLLLGTP